MVKKLCTHLCKWKNETFCNYSKNWGRGNKENLIRWRSLLKYDIFDTLLELL
jgi:hypothetical protein